MKMKVEEVKSLAAGSKCLEKAETMLKRRDRLKCGSRSFRRQLIEHMANYDPSDRSSGTMCEIMKQLDGIDADIYSLCKCVNEKNEESSVDLIKDKTDGSCGELVKESLCTEKYPAICSEVMRPYDPTTDEDAKSIHLRYIPELDSFKADMARNPCALRLPLMSPPMKRIMNKMKPCYLMDDVPCQLDGPRSKSVSPSPRTLTVGFVQFETPFEALNLPNNFETKNCLADPKDTRTNQMDRSNDMSTPNMWLVASQQLWQIYP